ncbi:MAG: DUF2845 domain-containing protein [Gammaproteobacteria bacterium]|nr:MAG: DUF2845 domain-containing protein [Gammaproteobacteria bacterium]
MLLIASARCNGPALWQLPDGRRAVLVEDWVFNFGPDKLMPEVTFENGRVENIEDPGYGYHD